MKKLTIIDGYAFLFRAYYATLKNNYLCTKNNIPTNAIYGFTNMINRIITNLDNDECVFVGFDSIKKSFRKDKFKDYKANRPACPEDLKIQMGIAHEFLDAMSIAYYEIDHFEGDDICGSLAKIASQNGYEVTIYTSDHDFFQLIDNHIKIKLIKIGLSQIQEVNHENIYSLYGFYANQLVDFKGLAGDKSDNLPGIPFVGEKIAKNLLHEYQNFENILKHAKEIKSPKISENIIKYQEQGRISKDLALIKTDLTFPFSIESLKYNGFLFDKIYNFCQKYELENLLNHLPSKFKKENMDLNNIIVKEIQDLPNKKYQTISLFLDFEKETKSIKNIVVCDYETTYVIKNKYCSKAKKLIQILKNQNIKKYVFNYTETKNALNKLKIDLSGLGFDLLLATNFINDNSIKNFITVAKNFNICLSENTDDYAIKCATLMFNLKEKISTILTKKEAYDFFMTIEIPFYEIATNIENKGILIKKKQKKIKNLDSNSELIKINNYIQKNINHNNYLHKIFNLNFDNQFLVNDQLNKQELNVNYLIQDKNFYFELFEYPHIKFEILAVLSKSQKIIELLTQTKDIYDEIKQIFKNNSIQNKELEDVINFGIIQGINETKLAQILNINKQKINTIIDVFYKNYPEIKNYFKNIILDLHQNTTIIKTFFNRPIYLKKTKINVNSQINETIVDIIKKISIQIYFFLKNKKLKSQLLIQMNNKFIFKIHKNEKKIVNQIKKIMTDSFNFPIKLKVLTKNIKF